MSAQHTPGPWHKEYDCGAYNIEAPAPGEPGKTFLVACAVSDRDLPIILAAPSMLAELRNALELIESLGITEGDTVRGIRSVISKVTGSTS